MGAWQGSTRRGCHCYARPPPPPPSPTTHGVPEVGRLLGDVEAAFGWTGRVAVRRYPPGLLLERIQLFHALTRKDAARIAELEAEVAAEHTDPAVLARYRGGKPLRGRWSVDADLVTSALLPDRIRYMPLVEREREFANHTGFLAFHTYVDGSTFCLSRLAVLTIGYWDENFYPAYFEDIDYWWRAEPLGFRAAPVSSDSKGAG